METQIFESNQQIKMFLFIVAAKFQSRKKLSNKFKVKIGRSWEDQKLSNPKKYSKFEV